MYAGTGIAGGYSRVQMARPGEIWVLECSSPTPIPASLQPKLLAQVLRERTVKTLGLRVIAGRIQWTVAPRETFRIPIGSKLEHFPFWGPVTLTGARRIE